MFQRDLAWCRTLSHLQICALFNERAFSLSKPCDITNVPLLKKVELKLKDKTNSFWCLKKIMVVLSWDLDLPLTSVCPFSSLCSSTPILSPFSKSFLCLPAQLSFFCPRNIVVMKHWEEVEGGKDWPTRKSRSERKVMILVSKLVNAFSSEEINYSHKKEQRKECGSRHVSNQ